jgi:broad specificity phosphatase PhoE
MSTIYLVRHGQASFGAASYDQLSAKGEQQAQVVGDFFKQTLKQTPLVVAGSMQRHQQTAQLALSQSFMMHPFKPNRHGMSLIISMCLLNMNRVLISLNC